MRPRRDVAMHVQGAAEIDGVPQHDGGCDERQVTGAVLLWFGGAVTQTTKTVEAHGPCQRVSAFALVQLGRRLPSQRGLFQPVQGAERAFYAADFAEGDCQAVLPWIGPEALEYQRGADCAGSDRGCQGAVHHPSARQSGVRRGARRHERRERRPVRGRSEAIEPTLAARLGGCTWCETESQQMGQSKDVMALIAAAVRV